ncbi:hypothetical protein [Pleionea sp. CnH1-48]|uniref:hypothetical protein n=1 Tax=Pleionea sp. CnH1-48 TaxID=2954494 RepID=UPI00209689A4|nr:hypothetical protein [Pleionea sp. CnH1-48]MCO7227499.1 hypothetical protein [Pleionea sp. CnH1-48]
MNYSILFFQKQKFMEVRFSGEVHGSDILRCLAEGMSDSRFKLGMSLLVDYTGAHPVLDLDDYEHMLAFAKKANPQRVKYCSAVVVDNEIDKGIASLWYQYTMRIPEEVYQIFSTRAEAMAWIDDFYIHH